MKKSIAHSYISGLKDKVKAISSQYDLEEMVDFAEFLDATSTTSTNDITHLRSVYPQCPGSLIDLLLQVDTRVQSYILGSDIHEFPYYLLSVSEILAENSGQFAHQSIRDIYGDKMDEWLPVTHTPKPGQGNRDSRIDPDIPCGKWLHFANCMNNGGSSKLFIDFNPCRDGTVGQIVRYLHDPDSYEIIADNFDAYLCNLLDNEYSFLNVFLD